MVDIEEMPTAEEQIKLGELIYSAFVELRWLAWEGKADQCADLADAFHNLPRVMYWNSFSWRQARYMMQSYQSKWPDHRRNYVVMLDAIHPPAEDDTT